MLNYRIAALAALVLSLAALIGGTALFQWPGATTRAAGSEDKATQGIAVSGEGIVYAEPDMAYVQVGVQTTATTAEEAQQKNADQMAKVIDHVLGLAIDRKDIRTSGISLYPIFDRRDGKPSTPTGYQANNQVSVTVRDLKKVAAVLDTAVAAGANTTGGISFGFKDDSRLRQEALAKAVENARQKAETIAQALGIRISGVQSVAEDEVNVPRPFEATRSMAPGASADATPVMPGQQTIVGHVRVVYSY